MNIVSTFLASFLIWLMFFGLAVFWIFRKELSSKQVLHIMLIIGMTLIVSQVIKILFPSPRPFVLEGSNPLTITTPSDGTFPSSHTAAAFAIVFGAFIHNRRVGALFFPPAVLVGFGRVLSHVHFPIDVLGGVLVALLISIVLSQRKFTS